MPDKIKKILWDQVRSVWTEAIQESNPKLIEAHEVLRAARDILAQARHDTIRVIFMSAPSADRNVAEKNATDRYDAILARIDEVLGDA